MHKGVILLMKADNKEDALSQANTFMNDDGRGDGNVRDRYVVGWRWNSILNPKHDEFTEKAKEILKPDTHWYITQNLVDSNQDNLQKLWEDMWQAGPNPYSNHYALPNDGWLYDIMELKDCIDVVKEWVWDLEKEAQENWDRMIKEKENEMSQDKPSYATMSAYYAWKYRDAKYWNFCFESNVYNIEESEAEKIPEDITWYRAVMIDMHN